MKKKRTIIQLFAILITNSYIKGFIDGKIFKGNSKVLCVPGLNCYSCPGALGSCPIGSLQAVLGNRKYKISYYVLGIIIFFGVMLGRVICGFLCPFGFIQDLLYKIPVPKIKIKKKIDTPLRYLKYVMLVVMVILLPLFLTNQFGIGQPYFCKWVCPVGTLEGGIPLILKNEGLRASLGFLFNWKLGILIIILIMSTFIYRPFCKYLCPLGAFYSFFNKISFYQMDLNKSKCISCGACERVCKMNVEVLKNINATECIRCGDCKYVCPTNAISSGFKTIRK